MILDRGHVFIFSIFEFPMQSWDLTQEVGKPDFQNMHLDTNSIVQHRKLPLLLIGKL